MFCLSVSRVNQGKEEGVGCTLYDGDTDRRSWLVAAATGRSRDLKDDWKIAQGGQKRSATASEDHRATGKIVE